MRSHLKRVVLREKLLRRQHPNLAGNVVVWVASDDRADAAFRFRREVLDGVFEVLKG